MSDMEPQDVGFSLALALFLSISVIPWGYVTAFLFLQRFTAKFYLESQKRCWFLKNARIIETLGKR